MAALGASGYLGLIDDCDSGIVDPSVLLIFLLWAIESSLRLGHDDDDLGSTSPIPPCLDIALPSEERPLHFEQPSHASLVIEA